MRWLLATIQVVLASTFLVAGIGKWLRVDDFAAALRLSHIPEAVVSVLTWCVPVLEVAIALSLVWGSARSILAGTLAAAVMLMLFSLWIAWVFARRIRIRCGCFGASQRSLGLHSLVRNLALLSLASVAVWLESADTNRLFSQPSVNAAIVVTSLAMALSLLVAFRRARPAMVLTPSDARRVMGKFGTGSSGGSRGRP
jgi:uncharacterized membrane protein YphA (DoxX/SURF4 family)